MSVLALGAALLLAATPPAVPAIPVELGWSEQTLVLAPADVLLRRVTLGPAQPLKITLVERDVEVAVNLQLADGRTLLASDGDVLRRGESILAATSSTVQTATLRIATSRPSRMGGVVQLRRHRVDMADPKSAQVFALDLLESQLLQASTDPQRARSPQLLAQARRLLDEREGGDLRALGRAVFLVDGLLRGLARHDEAIALLTGMEARFAAAGLPALQAQALNNLGMHYWRLGKATLAGAPLRRALDLPVTLEPLLGAMLQGNLCLVQIGQVSSMQAIACNREALQRSERSGDFMRISQALNNLGGAYAEAGDYQAALPLQQRNVELLQRQQLGGAPLARALGNLGLSQYRFGQLQAAREQFQRARELYEDVQDRSGAAQVQGYQAQLQLALGDAAGAYTQMQEVVRLRREIGLATELVQGLMRLADLDRLRGDLPAALAGLDEALTLTSDHSLPLLRVDLLLRRALLQLARADQAAAAHDLDVAEDLLAGLDSQDRRLQAQLIRARLARLAGEPQRALRLAAQACRSMDGQGWRLSAAEACELAGSTALTLRQWSVADALLARGLEQVEQVRADLLEGLERARFFAARRSLHEGRINALLEALPAVDNADPGVLRRALQLADTMRARTLNERRLMHVGATVSQPAAADLQTRQHALADDSSVLFWLLTPLRTYVWVMRHDRLQLVRLPAAPQLRPALADDLQRLHDASSLGGQIRATRRLCNRLWRPLLKTTLPPGRILLVADAELGAVPWPALRCGKGAGTELVRHYEFSLLPSLAALPLDFAAAPTATGRGDVLAVVDPAFPVDARLLDGALALRGGTPAQRDPRTSLGSVLDQQEPRGLPIPHPNPRIKPPDHLEDSGKVDQPLHNERPRTSGRESSHIRFYANVDSARGVGVYQRLPGTAAEARTLQTLLPSQQVQVLAGRDATVTGLLTALQHRYALVHIGTHGQASGQDTAQTGLVLLDAQAGTPQLLSVPQIFNSSVDADLVVLAACDSAAGATGRGEGVLGMGYAFLGAGASRVLASQWPVEDRLASRLLGRFYRHLLGGSGMTAAAALRQAQLDSLADPRTRAPRDWAAFALIDAQLGADRP